MSRDCAANRCMHECTAVAQKIKKLWNLEHVVWKIKILNSLEEKGIFIKNERETEKNEKGKKLNLGQIVKDLQPCGVQGSQEISIPIGVFITIKSLMGYNPLSIIEHQQPLHCVVTKYKCVLHSVQKNVCVCGLHLLWCSYCYVLSCSFLQLISVGQVIWKLYQLLITHYSLKK